MVQHSFSLIVFFVAMIIIITTTLLPTAATTTTVLAQSDRTFESEDDGFRLQIPQGWVIQDDDIVLDPTANYETIAVLCLENEALPGLGGDYNCQAANLTDLININRWSDLQSMPEFQNESDDSSGVMITTNDLVALWIQYLQNFSNQIQIENSTDIYEFRKVDNMTYTYYSDAGTPFNPYDDFTYDVRSAQMYVLNQDRDTGYLINNNIADDNQTKHSPAVREVFYSFELVI
jgi:hypothetical protein